ncbi:MAG TPA: HIT domain-containing protein [Actinomycetota bacterium]|nr:HIT domain-containing protein [Actinomycetota bacterium]
MMMERLWSPWRMKYMYEAGKSEGCLFCNLQQADDVEVHILHRGTAAFVVLNAYPYNTGHLMVAPTRHVGEVGDLTADERREIFDLTCTSVDVIRSAMGADGFNTGMNLGDVAGAGVPGHLHMHVVPRWAGDTNFMPVVGNTKVLPEELGDTAARLRPGFA